ncbi:TniB family NTP-binding protein [Pseudoalteromonas sp. T1lg75]|uniref:TniB family NTP-binding protein n=1 Tax=Pseudoalteromonas sp. T1lg75 TaxID=2077102 RepID=UPI000CF70601|nr:TniB family NTP-binding protein [Pseudoalteromonas sp. T1lg75]
MTIGEVSHDANNLAKLYCMSGKYKAAEKSLLHTIKYRSFETGGALLLGEPGIGKTSLAKKFLEEHHQDPLPEHNNVFGIYVEVPGGTLNGLHSEILRALGDENFNEGKLDQKKRRIIKLVNAMDVKVIFLDEVQVALPSSGVMPSSKFIKDIKELINGTRCSWVLCGTPEARDIRDVDEQLKSRFPKVIELDNFSFKGYDNKVDFIAILFDFLSTMPRKFPLFKCLNDSLVDEGIGYFKEVDYSNVLRLLCATNGSLRRLKLILMDCLERTDIDDELTKEIFAEAYAECFQGEAINPFTADMGTVKKLLIARDLYA